MQDEAPKSEEVVPGVMVNVSLAPLDSTDMALVRMWRNDHDVWRWFSQNDLISDAEQFQWYQDQSRDPKIKMYKIMAENVGKGVEKTSGAVGICGFTGISLIHRRAEFNILISPKARGMGLGKHALRVLMHHGFKNLGLNVIWGEVFETNPALKIFVRLGFRVEGTKKESHFKDGKFVDTKIVAMRASEWAGSHIQV